MTNTEKQVIYDKWCQFQYDHHRPKPMYSWRAYTEDMYEYWSHTMGLVPAHTPAKCQHCGYQTDVGTCGHPSGYSGVCPEAMDMVDVLFG